MYTYVCIIYNIYTFILIIFDIYFQGEQDPNDQIILSIVLAGILCMIFLSSIMINVSILLVFARKQSLRTTSNR